MVAIIDANGMQSDGLCKAVMDMGSHQAKWESFGWQTQTVDGHDVASLYDAFMSPRTPGAPSVLVASTVKGKGVSFMQNNNEWHHNRLSQSQYDAAMSELPE